MNKKYINYKKIILILFNLKIIYNKKKFIYIDKLIKY